MKNKNARKIFSLFFAVVILLTVMPIQLFAESTTVIDSGYCGGDKSAGYDSASEAYKNLTWTLYDDGRLVIAGKGEMKDYSDTISEGYGFTTDAPWAKYTSKKFTTQKTTLEIKNGVSYIGVNAFENCNTITGDLFIPESVTSIGESSFNKCSGFTGTLSIPDSVTSIGNYAFWNCSGFTGNLVLPNKLTSLDYYAFASCSGFTGNLVIPESMTNIGQFVFQGCSGFTGDLVIPESVTSIGEWAFEGCSGIYDIIFEGNAPSVKSKSDSFPSFPEKVIIHYTDGKTGFTDNISYDSEKGKWNGYKIKKGNAPTYFDVPKSHWAYKYIDSVNTLNIISGYPDGSFQPEKEVKVGEFIKMVCMAVWPDYQYIPSEGQKHWAERYVESLHGILNKYEYDAVKLEQVITREEAARLACRYMRDMGLEIVKDEKYLASFADSDMITEDSSRIYLDNCVRLGIINGFEDGTIRPNDSLTRAQAAKILYLSVYQIKDVYYAYYHDSVDYVF